MKRLAAALVALACILAPGRANAQAITQYTKVVSATSSTGATDQLSGASMAVLEMSVANDGPQTAYVSLAGTAVSSDTASVALASCETGTWYFPSTAPGKSAYIVTAGGQTATVRLAAFTQSNYQLGTIGSPTDRQPIFVKTMHCSAASGNESIGGNLSVTGTAAITGVATLTAQPIVSSLTASRLIVSDSSKGLASNGAITTNAVPKSASSGASLSASSISDDGTNVTLTEPLLGVSNVQGNMTAKALTSGAAAASVVVVTVPSGTTAGGKVDYCFEATDNTDFQARCGLIPFSAVNKAGTTTCTVGTVSTATEVVAVSAGTLAATWSCADGGSGALQIKATDTSSLTIGAGYDRVRYRVYGLAPSTLTVTAQ